MVKFLRKFIFCRSDKYSKLANHVSNLLPTQSARTQKNKSPKDANNHRYKRLSNDDSISSNKNGSLEEEISSWNQSEENSECSINASDSTYDQISVNEENENSEDKNHQVVKHQARGIDDNVDENATMTVSQVQSTSIRKQSNDELVVEGRRKQPNNGLVLDGRRKKSNNVLVLEERRRAYTEIKYTTVDDNSSFRSRSLRRRRAFSDMELRSEIQELKSMLLKQTLEDCNLL